ncbi:hypothetical protein LR48_Vigan01g225400 [Vigna angularis]|uniref:Uncharacterized protein n=1 Tax=Phaseolus angularis TaxID=3914 RepID=A0A0L9TQ31_PHAAN|nr:hypothetical protein LR48_Vigan01g225400 [Vigna angularis]
MKLTEKKGVKKNWRNQTPGLALQSIPWDNDLLESMPRQEVRRADDADDTAECSGSSDYRQTSSPPTHLNRKKKRRINIKSNWVEEKGSLHRGNSLAWPVEDAVVRYLTRKNARSDAPGNI